MKKLLVMAALVPSLCHAEFFSGNDLLQRINSESYSERGSALGYVMGVSDAIFGVVHCAPHDVTSGQLRDLMKHYLTNNPADRHNTANVLVAHVLKSIWPCAHNQRRGSAL